MNSQLADITLMRPPQHQPKYNNNNNNNNNKNNNNYENKINESIGFNTNTFNTNNFDVALINKEAD